MVSREEFEKAFDDFINESEQSPMEVFAQTLATVHVFQISDLDTLRTYVSRLAKALADLRWMLIELLYEEEEN